MQREKKTNKILIENEMRCAMCKPKMFEYNEHANRKLKIREKEDRNMNVNLFNCWQQPNNSNKNSNNSIRVFENALKNIFIFFFRFFFHSASHSYI